MIFSLDVRRARKGDCLLLHYGSKDDPGLVLIDGGPKQVYGPHLKPRLVEIRRKRKLDIAQKPLPIDLMMVSHVDDDHVQGLLELTSELRGAAGAPLVRIKRLWHNSFDEVIGNDPKELTGSIEAQFGAAALAGNLPEDADVDSDAETPEVVQSTLKVLASIAQGHKLRRDAEALNVRPNPEFGEKLILAAKEDVRLPNELAFTVAGPMEEELRALQKDHDAWLKKLKEEGLTPAEALAEYADKSVANLSSLVAIAKAGGKTILLTGDARGDKILEGLERFGPLKKGKTLHVDVLKVPHHGSSNNLELGFFQRITADHYVFSGNGEHGNPERESFEMLFDARGGAPYTLHVTYPIAEIDAGRKKDWEKEQAKEKARNKKRKAEGKPAKPVRANWSPARHSLAALLKKRPLAAGQTLRIVDKDKAHVIDLLEPLGF
jgi:hypothetical protein